MQPHETSGLPQITAGVEDVLILYSVTLQLLASEVQAPAELCLNISLGY